MADIPETLKNLLGDGAEDKIKSVISSLSAADAPVPAAPDNIDELKSLIGRLSSSRGDPRAQLLLSLRPYLRPERQSSVDSAVKLLNLSRIAALFK